MRTAHVRSTHPLLIAQHWGHVATGILEVATVAQLKTAIIDNGLSTIRITEDLVLTEEIAFTRNSPLVLEGACGGGTRACTITPARSNPTFFDAWGYTCAGWRGYCGEDSSIDVCPVPSVPEVGPDGSTCEVDGYVDASGYYYSKAYMDEVRSQCPLECAVVLDSGSSDYDYDFDYDYDYDSDSVSHKVARTRFFAISLNLQPGQELSFVGLSFDGGRSTDGVGPVGTAGASQRVQFCFEARQQTC
jgi:hypothetical protein